MKIVEHPVRRVRRRAYCNKCNQELISTGKAVWTYPTEEKLIQKPTFKYDHNCGCTEKTWYNTEVPKRTQILGEEFPRTVWVEEVEKE